MINVSFKRDAGKNYMILYEDGLAIRDDDYRLKMLGNDIPGLLSVGVIYQDMGAMFRYNISGMTNMEEYFRDEKLTFSIISNLHRTLIETMKELEEHLLDSDKILFNSKYIFIEDKSKKIYFSFFPGKDNSFLNDSKEIYKYMISIVDYNDRRAVEMVYSFETLAMRDKYSIEEMENILGLYRLENDETNNDFRKAENSVYKLAEKKGQILDNGCVDKSVFDMDNYWEENEASFIAKIGKKIKTIIMESDTALLLVKCHRKIFRKKKNISQTVTEISEMPEDKEDNKIYYRSQIRKKVYVDDEPNNEGHDMTTILYPESDVHIELSLEETGTHKFGRVDIKKYPTTIGKRKDRTDIQLDNETISRIHCRLTKESGRIYIEDLNSTNGTIVNGQILDPYSSVEIKEGDYIKIGATEFRVCVGRA